MRSATGLGVRMQGTSFVSWAPADGEVFDCDPKYLVTVSTPEVASAQLDENRRSTRYTGG